MHLAIGFDLLKTNLKYWWTVVLISKIPAYWDFSGSTATITPFWNLSNYSDNHIIKTDIHYSYLQLYPLPDLIWVVLSLSFPPGCCLFSQLPISAPAWYSVVCLFCYVHTILQLEQCSASGLSLAMHVTHVLVDAMPFVHWGPFTLLNTVIW